MVLTISPPRRGCKGWVSAVIATHRTHPTLWAPSGGGEIALSPIKLPFLSRTHANSGLSPILLVNFIQNGLSALVT